MQKKKSTTKETVKKNSSNIDQLERTERISHVIGVLSQFTPINYTSAFEMRPLFSREFLLKNLLGMTEEEYNLNEELIYAEQTELLQALDTVNQVLNTQNLINEQEEAVVETKKSKKNKEKVN